MASEQEVKVYLAHWFQLGKKLIIQNGREIKLLPDSIFRGNDYSPEFEACWQKIINQQGQNCYLEGATQTIAELLSSVWVITNCARCSMPVPIVDAGLQAEGCPCSDLPGWPNSELPKPRSPVDSQQYLMKLQQRLKIGKSQDD